MRRVLLLVAAVVAVTNLTAQSIYLDGGVGYSCGMGTSSQEIMGYTFPSLGAGVNYNLGAGYDINEDIAIELRANILDGKKVDSGNATMNLNSISILPLVRYNIAVTEEFTAYAKAGLNLMLFSQTKLTIERSEPYINYFDKYKVKGKCRLGALLAVGGSYRIDERIDIYGELSANFISFAAKRGKLTESTVNGIDLIELTSEQDKSFYFDTESHPSARCKANSIGFNIGVNYRLNLAGK